MNNEVILRAIRLMKQSKFKATAVKVELEAHLERGSEDGCDGCDDCYGGYTSCDNCDDGYYSCGECSGGFIDCPECDGGVVTLHADTPRETTGECEECNGSGDISCPGGCDEGYFSCDDCEGGRVTCGYCGGDGGGEWNDSTVCHDYILRQLEPLGLAEPYNGDENNPDGHDGRIWGEMKPKYPLVYSQFYRDGSVDSELTFTLSIKEPENIFLLPKVIDAFKSLSDEIGHGINTNRAGMHMALLQDPDMRYPVSTNNTDQQMFTMFKKSMTLLLPALYFLGTSNERSRDLSFRTPRIANSHKYSAIYYSGRALEFRVFDTCYDNPESIFDNLVVMGNCMHYWTDKYKDNGLNKLANNIRFGQEGSDKLERFYVTTQHIDLLNRGLAILKPNYYTITQIKQQRKFGITKTHINNQVKRVRKEAIFEYREYEERFGWALVMYRNSHIATIADRIQAGRIEPKPMAEIELEADSVAKEHEVNKKSIDQYVEDKIAVLNNRGAGEYTLAI